MIDAPRRFFQRPLLWAPALVVVGLLLAWWFAWMAPEGSKLSSVQAQHTTEEAAVASLQAKIAELRTDTEHEQATKTFLKQFAGEIPAAPDAPELVVQVYHLAVRDGVQLESITDDTVAPTTDGYSSIPVNLAVSGSQPAIVNFVSGLYQLPRLLTIQQLSLSGSGNVITGNGSGTYSASLTATAYTTSATAMTPSTPTSSSS